MVCPIVSAQGKMHNSAQLQLLFTRQYIDAGFTIRNYLSDLSTCLYTIISSWFYLFLDNKFLIMLEDE